jgi:hypothetical protein
MIDFSKLFAAITTSGQSALIKVAVVLIGSIVLLVIGFAAGWHSRGIENASATIKAQIAAVDTGNHLNAADYKAAQQHEAKREAQAKNDKHIAIQAAVDVAKTPDYNACQLKPADLYLLNQAIDGGAL